MAITMVAFATGFMWALIGVLDATRVFLFFSPRVSRASNTPMSDTITSVVQTITMVFIILTWEEV